VPSVRSCQRCSSGHGQVNNGPPIFLRSEWSKAGSKRSSVEQSGEPAPELVNGGAERTPAHHRRRSSGARRWVKLPRKSAELKHRHGWNKPERLSWTERPWNRAEREPKITATKLSNSANPPPILSLRPAHCTRSARVLEFGSQIAILQLEIGADHCYCLTHD